MGIGNQSIGSDWRGWGVRMGLVSMMAATGMGLVGHAVAATPMVTQPSGGDGTGGIIEDDSNQRFNVTEDQPATHGSLAGSVVGIPTSSLP